MNAAGRATGPGPAVSIALAALHTIATSREEIDTLTGFDERSLPADLDSYLAESELHFPDIVPGTEKRIRWHGDPGVRTPLSVIYIHGFSATSEELRPVPDLVAEALGANLHFTRLAGHGRGGAAMAEASVAGWMRDVAEALAIGRRIGEEVLVIATSTGGTLMAIAATDARLIDRVKGIVFVSPNFRLLRSGAAILTLPGGRWWGPILAGREQGFEPLNDRHARFWTTRYPSVAAFPMGTLVREARRRDYSGVAPPALFVFADADRIVSAAETRSVAKRWGGPVELRLVEPAPGDDPFAHVVAGDILSPGGTQPVASAILDWMRRL